MKIKMLFIIFLLLLASGCKHTYTEYYCDHGDLINDNMCMHYEEIPATVTYQCYMGTLSGDQCITTYNTSALYEYTCPYGYTKVMYSFCESKSGLRITASKKYYCTSGQLSGMSCINTLYADAYPIYSCPFDYTLEGNMCSRWKSYFAYTREVEK